jgi:hypothetical protein
MPSIDFSAIITATPEPYNPFRPDKQRENLAAVWMQILDQLADQGEILDIDLIEVIKALQFNNAVIRWGDLEITLTHQSASQGIY